MDCLKYDVDGWIGVFSFFDVVCDYGIYKVDWFYFCDWENCIFEFVGCVMVGDYELCIILFFGNFIVVCYVFVVFEGNGVKFYILGNVVYRINEFIEVMVVCGLDVEVGFNWIVFFKVGVLFYNYGI